MPPYSDNLYSSEEHVDQNLSEGTGSDHGTTQGTLVEDPSLAERMAAVKAEESRAEAQQHRSQIASSPRAGTSSWLPGAGSSNSANIEASPNSSRRAISSSRSSFHLYDASSSMLYSAPPPAYSPSGPDDSQFRVSAAESHYNTFSPSPTEGLSSRPPQSMGNPEEASDRQALLPRRHDRATSWRRDVKARRLRRCTKYILLGLLLIAIVSAAVTAVVKSKSSGDTSHTEPPIETEPPKSPVLPGPNHSFCREARFRKGGIGLAQDMDRISIKQTHRETLPGSTQGVRTLGVVSFRRAESGVSNNDTSVTMEVWVSDTALDVDVLAEQNSGFHISTPRSASGLTPDINHCISLEITVWLPQESTFDSVEVQTTTLAIDNANGMLLNARKSLQLSTISGQVTFPPMRDLDGKGEDHIHVVGTDTTNREIRIHTDSGSISGTYSLFDVLEISTISGTTDVSIVPQEASRDHVETPAALYINSKSGSITAKLPVHLYNIPVRTYETTIRSVSGSISGTYYLGSITEMSTSSASLDLELLPCIYGVRKARFHTTTISGSTKILVLPLVGKYHAWHDISKNNSDVLRSHPRISPTISPVTSGRRVLDNLVARHSTKSGHLNIEYPSEWQGEIEVQTVSASIDVRGDGVQIVTDRKEGWVKRVLRAIKGSKGSECFVESISGKVDITVG